jgi:multiple sugar transport system permease protein
MAALSLMAWRNSATEAAGAYAFSRLSFRGRDRLMLSYLLVRMFPAVMVIIPLFVMMRTLARSQ